MLILIIFIGSIFLIEALALYIEYRSAKKIADSIIESVGTALHNQKEESKKHSDYKDISAENIGKI